MDVLVSLEDRRSAPAVGSYASGSPWVGRSLGIMDTFLAWVGADERKMKSIAVPKRILVANTGHLGDAILATSVLPVLRDAFPHCHVGFVTGSWSQTVLQDHALVDEVHVFDHWKVNRGPDFWWRKLRQHESTRRQALDEIADRGYDVAIDLRPYFGNAIPLFWQAGIPVRIGYTSGGFGPLLTHPVAWRRRDWHVVDYHRSLLELLPLQDEHLARLQPTLEYRRKKTVQSPRAAALMESPNPYLVLHMGSGAPFKEWPLEKWRALIRRLASTGRTVVFTGAGPAEVERCDSVRADAPDAVDVCDQLGWPDLLAVIRGASLLVTVDSMAGHLAAALKTPCVIISNGINHPAHWQPRTSACRVLLHPVACSPCFKAQGCPTMDCVRNITVEQVMNAIDDLSIEPRAK